VKRSIPGVLCLLVVLAGCNSQRDAIHSSPSRVAEAVAHVVPEPDPDSGVVWVKHHPKLQKICDAVGGCENVTVKCEKYDGTGNTNLRNTTWWEITADGTEGQADIQMGGFDGAVRDWFSSRAWDQEDHSDHDIYPNSRPCNLKESCR